MIVCICLNISDHDILKYMAAHPKASELEICTKTGIGKECGICMQSFHDTFNNLGKTGKKATKVVEKNEHKKKSGDGYERKKKYHRRAK